jgi:hypothetical protein
LLGRLDLLLLVKPIQDLQGGRRRGQPVSDQFRQTRVLAQALKVLWAFAPGGIQNDGTLDESPCLQAPGGLHCRQGENRTQL